MRSSLGILCTFLLIVAGGDLGVSADKALSPPPDDSRGTSAPSPIDIVGVSPLAHDWFEKEAPPPLGAAPTTFVTKNQEDGGDLPEDLEDTSVSQYGVKCIQKKACEYYGDTLLVLKLNPVRLLWLDALLNFYGTAFKNIVFYSALQKDDSSTHKWLRVGGRRVFVRLMDDNYGFCDHATLADAAARHQKKNFAGFIYLSDDVLMMWWKFIGQPKTSLWKQKPSINPKSDTIDDGTMKAIRALNSKHGYTLSTKNLLFAATSGCYYVPNDHRLLSRFKFISSVLLKHRSYNEWGTPLLLSAIFESSKSFADFDLPPVIILRGKLVWGWKRVLVKKMFNYAYSWYHPIRANGEVFQRLNLFVHEEDNLSLDSDSKIDMIDIFNKYCLNCASYPKAQRQMKGLLHDCVVAKSSRTCGTTADAWKGMKDANLIGGRVVVPEERQFQLSSLELKHEGFWNKNLTIYMYQTHYGYMNKTKHSGKLLQRYPECCFED